MFLSSLNAMWTTCRSIRGHHFVDIDWNSILASDLIINIQENSAHRPHPQLQALSKKQGDSLSNRISSYASKAFGDLEREKPSAGRWRIRGAAWVGPQRVRIPPTPRTWRGALRPEAAAEPPGPSAPRPAVPRVRTHLGHQLGRGTGPRLSFPSPGLAGLCGAWNSAVFRTCGPGSLRAGADEVRPERDLCRPGVGLRVPMTATVTLSG